MQRRPVKRLPGVGFSTGCYIIVADNPGWSYVRITTHYFADNTHQLIVLPRCISKLICTFQLNTDRVIVTKFAAPPNRFPSMPGPAIKRDKLSYFAAPIDQQVC